MLRSALAAAAFAALISTSTAQAAVETINRTGHIVAQVPADNGVFNPGGVTALSDYAVGEAFTYSATYDTADLVNPGVVDTFLGEPVSGPEFLADGLGSGNPVNAVSFVIGDHSLSLSDQGCFQDPACVAAVGMEWPAGPTLLFNGPTFLGMDSCLIEGGGGFGTGDSVCSLVLDNLAPTLQSFNTQLLGYTRTDLFLFNDPAGNTVFVGQFDGPGVAGLGVPEPTSWALMISGFGLAGATLRRRRGTMVAA